ncbi:esterase-like activity of phytase family protein [Desulfatiferula olefinivorans]
MIRTKTSGKALAACLAAGMSLFLSACDESFLFFSRTATLPVYESLPQGVDPGTETVAEIIAATSDGMCLIHTDSPGKALVLIDNTDPENPRPAGRVLLGGEPTSVAVSGRFALAAVNTSESFAEPGGHLAVVDLKDPQVIATVDVGGQPDSLAVSPDGRYLAVVVENERDEDLNDGLLPQEPAGFLGVFALGRDGKPSGNMHRVDLTGLADVAPEDPEPEYVAINDHNTAVVTLQENNHIVLVNLHKKTIVHHFSAGSVTLKHIPTTKDSVDGTGSIESVKREPDAVAWVDNNRFVTANEGDYEGGSRGFTIWRADGSVQYDSGPALEHLAMSIGHYPASRAGKKGTEPEGIAVARYGGRTLIFVGSERGNFVAVYEDRGPDARPDYRQALPTNAGPEGLLTLPGRNLFITASEEDSAEDGFRSAVQIFSLDALSPGYPAIESDQDPATSAPIGWGALSGLAADLEDCWRMYAVSDGFYPEPRIFTLDVSTCPVRIESYVAVTGGTAGAYDLEGLSVSAQGGFWAVSEGNPAKGLVNRLIRISEEGRVTAEHVLPEALESQAVKFGFEGVAEVVVKGKRQVIVAVQREWKDDDDGLVKLALFDPDHETWSFVHYPLAPPSAAGSWVGLSEIVAVGGSDCLVIERDNVGGPDAAIKAVTRIHLDGIVPVAYGERDLPIVSKEIVTDLLPKLRETRGWTPDKVEGLALSADGRLYAVTDNDGVKDATGETLFLDLGMLLDLKSDMALSLFF